MDHIVNDDTNLTLLHEKCSLLQNVLHDVLALEVGGGLTKVRYRSKAFGRPHSRTR
jgi:hypothetical protein